jgi:hypothetical protein
MNTENTMTKMEQVLNVLQSGEELTAKQIRHRFGLATNNSARALISKLRSEGYAVYSNEHTNSKGHVKNKYRLGAPSRLIVAAGIQALRAQGINALG